jgi:hypothetical protein
MDKTSIINELKTALQIVLFKQHEIHAVTADKGKTKFAYGIIITGAVLSFLSQKLFLGSLLPIGYGLLMALIQVALMVVGIYLISFVAKKAFKGQGTHDGFFRTAAYASILGWVVILMPIAFWIFGLISGAGIISIVSLVLGIWGLALIYTLLKSVHKLTSGNAVITIVIFIIAGVIIGKLFGFGYQPRSTYKFDTDNGVGTFNPSGNGYEFNYKGEEGSGSVKLDDGKMIIKTEDGQEMQIDVPQQ